MAFPAVTIWQDGKPVMRSKNLAAIVRYAKQRADLRYFRIDERQSGPLAGYAVEFIFDDGARAQAVSLDWRVAVSFLARGSRRENGPFPANLICLSAPAGVAEVFRQLQTAPPGRGRQGCTKTTKEG